MYRPLRFTHRAVVCQKNSKREQFFRLGRPGSARVILEWRRVEAFQYYIIDYFYSAVMHAPAKVSTLRPSWVKKGIQSVFDLEESWYSAAPGRFG